MYIIKIWVCYVQSLSNFSTFNHSLMYQVFFLLGKVIQINKLQRVTRINLFYFYLTYSYKKNKCNFKKPVFIFIIYRCSSASAGVLVGGSFVSPSPSFVSDIISFPFLIHKKNILLIISISPWGKEQSIISCHFLDCIWHWCLVCLAICSRTRCFLFWEKERKQYGQR